MTTGPKRPLLRYFGGKWRLAPWIVSHFPSHRTYVEPYGGGASILLRKPRSYAEVYNDLDGEVVNLFAVARDRGEELARAVTLTPFSRAEFMAAYERDTDPVERARRLLVLSHQGFGSDAACGIWHTGFRGNVTRSSTTPAGDWSGLPAVVAAVCQRLKGVVIEQRPAIAVMAASDGPDTLHYCDPPYPIDTRGKRKKGTQRKYRCEMTDKDHEDLATFLRTLTGAVQISGYDCELYRRLYPDWIRYEHEACADGGAKRTEVLWVKPGTTRKGAML